MQKASTFERNSSSEPVSNRLMRQLVGILLVCAAVLACGPKRPDPKLLAAEAARRAAELRATAETRVLQGCYDCLLEAKATYEQLATGARRPEFLTRLFEVELLIALREKELSIDATAALARARAIAAELPPAIGAARYLAVADAVPPDETGWPIARSAAFRRSKATYVAGLDNEIAWLMGDASLQLPVRQYLALALDCNFFRRARPPSQVPAAGLAATPQAPRQIVLDQIPKDAPTIVQYRLGFCGNIQRGPLERAHKEEPRYAEAAYFLARLDVSRASETGASSARPLLAEALARFPNSPAVTYLAGNYQQLIGDCKAALPYYDQTLAIEPVHDNALLGRTICFASLKRFDDSIAAATHMIGIPSSHLAEAYYWRAWVRHYLKDLPQARADIDRAKQILSSNDIHRLAGVIEYDQDDLPNADKDLNAAKQMYNGQYDCVARWYLGLLEMKRERWVLSAANFEDSMGCYERAAYVARAGLQKMLAAENVDPEFKARQIAGFEAAIKEDTSQQYAAAFNAANHYARGGDPAKARTLLEIAARDPALEARVAELRKILGGGRSAG
jgi:hypothetical protein